MAPLVIVSIDGFSAALAADSSLRVPALRALVAQGVSAAGLRPAFPSVTWPCHTTVITGTTPARHGILGNEVIDRASGRVLVHEGDVCDTPPRVPTLWDVTSQAGLSTAALCWPKTRGAKTLGDNVPELLDQALFEACASRPLWDEGLALGLPLTRYAEWSTQRTLNPLQDWLTLELARHLVRRRAPDLLLVHFLTLDSFQHEFGPASPEARWALEHIDGLVGTLLAELETAGRRERTNVIVLGDHGFVDVSQRCLPNDALRAAGLLTLDARGQVTGATARAATPGVSQVLAPDAFTELGLPRPEDDATQGDLVLHAAEGWFFSRHTTAEHAAGALGYRGTHGHFPDDPRLHAAFLAAGPAVASAGYIGVLDQLDVAPTAAALLGVAMPTAERPASALVLRDP